MPDMERTRSMETVRVVAEVKEQQNGEKVHAQNQEFFIAVKFKLNRQ